MRPISVRTGVLSRNAPQGNLIRACHDGRKHFQALNRVYRNSVNLLCVCRDNFVCVITRNLLGKKNSSSWRRVTHEIYI